MLIIENQNYFEKVLRFARATDQLPKLLKELWRLHTFGQAREVPDQPPAFAEGCGQFPPPEWTKYGDQTQCFLHSDFAPASFYFVLEKGGQRWFNGGLIYHGKQAGWTMPNGQVIPEGFGVETFNVQLVSSPENPWSINT